MRRVLAGAVLALLLAGCADDKEYGAIPDEATAKKVGCAVIHARFPKGDPDCPGLAAELDGNIWTVAQILPKNTIGGGPVVRLSKSDGQVLDFYLTQ